MSFPPSFFIPLVFVTLSRMLAAKTDLLMKDDSRDSSAMRYSKDRAFLRSLTLSLLLLLPHQCRDIDFAGRKLEHTAPRRSFWAPAAPIAVELSPLKPCSSHRLLLRYPIERVARLPGHTYSSERSLASTFLAPRSTCLMSRKIFSFTEKWDGKGWRRRVDG